jgi:SNF2 family DNA or RNA helicase
MTIYNGVLFDYQKLAAKRIQEQRSVLLADQPGLGKTLEVLGALELDGLFERPSNILILTPIINAQTTWRDSIVRWVQDRYDVSLIDVSKGTSAKKDKQFENLGKTNIVLANHNALDLTPKGVRVHGIIELTYDAVIVDESHLVLPIKDQRKLTNFWRGLRLVNVNDNAIKVAISGTPDRGKLENRYGTWKFLHPDKVSSRWEWLEQNFHIVEQKVSRTRTIQTTAGLRKQHEWLERDKHWMIRRTKTEVLPQLPPKRYVDVEIELGNGQKAAYFGQQQESTEKIFNARIEERNSPEAMLFALRARQLSDCTWRIDGESRVPVVGSESAKLDWLMAWLDERGFIERDAFADNQAQVVIVSQFSKVLHWLREELNARGIESAILDGSTSDSNRVAVQQNFQAGNLRIVLLSGSMGVGINLDRADDLIMFDSPYDPDRIEQIEDRVHRASSNHHVTIWNLISIDTIDEAIMEKVSNRYQTTRELMDGSRGVEFARKVLELANG